MIFRSAAIAAFSLATVFAQSEPATVPATSGQQTSAPGAEPDAPAGPKAESAPESKLLEPDESDPGVERARASVLQIRKLVNMGALSPLKLKKAEDDVRDALDMTILKKSLYSQDLLPDQVDQMILVAERMVVRRQRAMDEMQQLVTAGVISRAEADMTSADLRRAQTELDWAKSRAELVRELAESVRLEKNIASLETEAPLHPEWDGKIVLKYQGSGIFTPAERAAIETAYLRRFFRTLPVSADGETAVHRSLGFDHRGRIDVALNPDQPEGVWLRHYLESKRIPYFAFRAAVAHKATGAHIHIGPESTKLVPGE